MNYKPLFLPGAEVFASKVFSVVGHATASLRPTDIVLVVENTASFVKEVKKPIANFSKAYGAALGKKYTNQCFSPSALELKKGLIGLYDSLSQIGTFRIALVTTSSKTTSPLVLSKLGQTELKAEDLEDDNDQPDNHSTRCALGTLEDRFLLPKNPNSLGKTWETRHSLKPLLRKIGSKAQHIPQTRKLLSREALWLLPFGNSTASGFLHPKYYFVNPIPAVKLAGQILDNSRRTDGLPVAERIILAFIDDSGEFPRDSVSSLKRGSSICKEWKSMSYSSKIKLGILYYGHRDDIPGHQRSAETLSLKKDCHDIEKNSFFIDTSAKVSSRNRDFRWYATNIAQALKQVELRH